MEIKNNFLNIIAFGSFNPAILTPPFLTEEKIFGSEINPEGQTSPVVSVLKYGNISFLVELEKFQLMDNQVDSFEKSSIISIGEKYLDVLKYTPVSIEGINFNVDFTNYNDSLILQSVFRDPLSEIINCVDKVREYELDVKTKITEGKNETQVINCRYCIDDGVLISINLRKLDEKIVLNFNYEVQNIRLDRNRLNIIPSNYQNICEKFDLFVRKIEE